MFPEFLQIKYFAIVSSSKSRIWHISQLNVNKLSPLKYYRQSAPYTVVTLRKVWKKENFVQV